MKFKKLFYYVICSLATDAPCIGNYTITETYSAFLSVNIIIRYYPLVYQPYYQIHRSYSGILHSELFISVWKLMPNYCINTLFRPLMSRINELSLLIGSLFEIGSIP